MGTNYYAVSKPCADACAHCALQQEVHVCKSLTMFRAYLTNPFEPDADPILSWRDWRDELAIHAACIRDEYGREQPVSDFVQHVQATSRLAREKQYRWMVDNALDSGADDFLDIDGFSFNRREFS
jgi:hypothetical protein